MVSGLGEGLVGVITCVACSAKVNSEAIGCPECGVDPRTGKSLDAPADPDLVRIPRGRYLGGLPWAPHEAVGALIMTPERIGVGDINLEPPMMLWTDDVVRIEITDSGRVSIPTSTGSTVAAVAVGAVVFGVIGALVGAAMSGPEAVNRVVFAIHTRRGDERHTGYFAVDSIYESRLTERLRPFAEKRGIEIADSPATPPPPQGAGW